MRRIGFGILAALLVVALAVVSTQVIAGEEEQEETYMTITPDELEWQDAPASVPEGAQMTVLQGDPTDEGLAIWRLRIPADWEFPPHTHPVDERVTILEGAVNIGVGETLDKDATERLEAGSHFSVQAGQPHYVWFEEETIVQFSTDGATGTEYVNPEDDPRVEAGESGEETEAATAHPAE